MNGPDEKQQIAQVIERLEEKFPEVSDAEVQKVVEAEVANLEGNPVRDYVPRLVEHGARSKLREAASS